MTLSVIRGVDAHPTIVLLNLLLIKLVCSPHSMAQGTEKLLRLLNQIQKYSHTLNIELLGLNVVDDSPSIIGKL